MDATNSLFFNKTKDNLMKQAVPIFFGSLLLLTACGSDDAENSSQEVADDNATVQETLNISGKVVDDVIPDATVTITVDDETYTTTANADGDYTLEVSFTNGAELLTINARGSEDHGQAFVELVSALPSFNSLSAAAGDDGVLDSSESFGTNVTNVTTANYALMLEASAGEAPTDEEALSLAQEAVDATELLEMSAVIKLIIDEGRSMPEGSESVLDFVKNTESYKAEVEKIKTEDANALENMINTIIADDNLVQKKASANLPSFYIPTQATAPGFVSMSSEVLTFNDDGTGNLVSTELGMSRSFTWTLSDDGFYTIDYDESVGNQGYVNIVGITDDQDIIDACHDANVYQITAVSVETSRQFKPVVKGNRVDMVRQNVSRKTEYDTSLCVGSPVVPSQTFEDSFSTEYSDASGTWELTDDGALDMFYDGIEQSVEMFNQVNGLYGSLMSAEKEDGTHFAAYNRVVKQNPDVSLTADDLLTEADEFWFGHINSWTRSAWNEEVDLPKIDYYWGWQFKSPTEAFNVSVTCEEYPEQYFCEHGVTTQKLDVGEQLDWLLKEDGKLVQIDRVDEPEPFYNGDRIRRWHVLDVTDDGWIYVLEFDFYDQTPGNDTDDISEIGGAYNRINMMDKTKLPDGLSH